MDRDYYSEGYAAWIDYNNDGDFDDSGEQIWSKAASTDTPNSGTFTVPNGTSEASVRMRVSMKYNGIPTSCETFTYGEVEDYTVNLEVGSGGDTQAPSTPASLTASNVGETTLDLSWNASSDNVGVTGYNVFIDGSNIGNVTGTSANITGLTANTSYDFNVQAFDAAGNTSALSNTASATTTGSGGGGPGVIAAYYFETDSQGWSDPGSDCRRDGGAAYAFEGSYSMRLRDNTSTSNTVSPVLDLTGNSEITFEFHFYPRGMDVGDDFFVEFYNGSSYEVIGQYVRGTDFNNNTFYSETITLDASSYSFNAGNRFRLRNDATVNNDRVYFDQIIVSGDNVSRVTPVVTENTQGVSQSFTRAAADNIKLYPNPASTQLTIEILDLKINNILIYAPSGALVKKLNTTTDELNIDVTELSSGIYFVQFISNDGLAVTKRFIKE